MCESEARIENEAEKMRARCIGAGSTSGNSEDEVVVGCGGSIIVHEPSRDGWELGNGS